LLWRAAYGCTNEPGIENAGEVLLKRVFERLCYGNQANGKPSPGAAGDNPQALHGAVAGL